MVKYYKIFTEQYNEMWRSYLYMYLMEEKQNLFIYMA